MVVPRTDKLNSLLQEVIAEVISREVKDPSIHPFTSVTSVHITTDLAEAKVSISVLGTSEERTQTVKALNKAAGYIAVTASKKIVLRHFPVLIFTEDSSVEKQMHIDTLIKQIEEERSSRKPPDEPAV